MLQVKISSLRWVVGIFCALVGAMMLVVPHQFGSPIYAAIRPHLTLWGLAFLLSGIGLLALASLKPRPAIEIGIHLAVGAELLVLAYGILVARGWTATPNFIVLGMGAALAPWLVRAPRRGGKAHDTDLLALTIGLGSVLTGLTILALPGQFSIPLYDYIRPLLPWLGVAFLISGLALVYVQVRSAEPDAVYALAHFFAGATLLAYFLTSAVPLRAWTGIAYYGVFGATILLLPWLEVRLRRVDPRSLQTRLALVLGVAAGLPLIVIVALITAVVVAGGSGDQVSIQAARDLSFVFLIVILAVMAVAGVYVSRLLAAPLNALALAARKLASGDATSPLPETDVGEIADLTAAFGEMRDRLATRTAERERLLMQVEQERQRAEISAAEAQQQADEMQAAFAAMNDALIVFDADGVAIRANQAAISFLGFDPAGKVRKAILENRPAHGPDRRPVDFGELPLSRALRGETVVHERLLFTNAEGREATVLASAAPLQDHGTIRGGVIVWHDITDLSELDRLKDQFISVAAHELKTPLTVMKGYAQALLRQTDDLPPARRRILEAINRGTDRIHGIVNDLLDISQLQQGQLRLELESVDLGDLVTQVADQASLFAPGHQISVTKAEPVVVRGDRYRLRQVLNHLVENAVKYSPKGGEITLAVELKDKEAVVSVTDQGVGIPEEKQAGMFQRFYRAHTGTPYDYGGIGVGLYICKEIVSRHHGRMWFESEEGKGSTFSFALPLTWEGEA